MVTKRDLEKMLNPLPNTIRKRYLDRVLTLMKTEKEDRSIFLYIVRALFHDFIKPINMMNALSEFASTEAELSIKSIALGSPEILLTNVEMLVLYGKLRTHFLKLLDDLEFKDEFKDFLEVNFDFLKGEP